MPENPNGARLRCPSLNLTLDLPWWPSEVSRTLSVRTVNELERPGKTPLVVPNGPTLDEYQVAYMLRRRDRLQPVAGHIKDLETLATTKKPVQLLLGQQVEGLFRIDSPTITIIEFATDGKPSVCDVSLTLKRASDAVVNVGLVKRIRGRVNNAARRS